MFFSAFSVGSFVPCTCNALPHCVHRHSSDRKCSCTQPTTNADRCAAERDHTSIESFIAFCMRVISLSLLLPECAGISCAQDTQANRRVIRALTLERRATGFRMWQHQHRRISWFECVQFACRISRSQSLRRTISLLAVDFVLRFLNRFEFFSVNFDRNEFGRCILEFFSLSLHT